MNWEQAIQDYSNYLKLERGLSNNSISSYSLDIRKLVSYVHDLRLNINPDKIEIQTVQQFIYHSAKSINPRSQSRLISALRGFFDYLIFENYMTINPLELIESPKIGRKLPDTLSIEEIDTLISSIDLGTPQGERNRAIIETLYSCGLRVSELTNIKISDLFFEEGFIKVTGKGNKQRFVPISSLTQKYIELYKDDVRPHVPLDRQYLRHHCRSNARRSDARDRMATGLFALELLDPRSPVLCRAWPFILGKLHRPIRVPNGLLGYPDG